MSDELSAAEAQHVIDACRETREIGEMSTTEEETLLAMERLARTVIELGDERESLLATHDALRAAALAAGWTGAAQDPAAMLARITERARREGAETMRTAALGAVLAAIREACADADGCPPELRWLRSAIAALPLPSDTEVSR